VRDIYRALRSPRKPVIEAIKALEQDGQVVQEFILTLAGSPQEATTLTWAIDAKVPLVITPAGE
jgi:hypothetical protein